MLAERHSHKKYILPIILLSLVIVALSTSTVIQTNNLHKTQDTLAFTRTELTTTQANLTQTRTDLATTRTELTTTQANLAQTRTDLATTRTELTTTQANLAQTRTDLATTQTELRTTQTNLVQTQTQLATTQAQVQLYKDTWGSVVASGVIPPFQGANIVSQANISNPTWAQLQSFLLADKTDQHTYIPNLYVCGDYARDVYNNAERLGIRAAYVAIKFSYAWHACNAFKTTDRGLVFINCTGLQAGTPGPSNRDKIVNVRLGKDYIPISMFPEPGWEVAWGDIGTILDVQIYW